ncbi:MAG: 2-hydroxyacyl-CoA dehydratase family protein [Promethearchaeota archaeon]
MQVKPKKWDILDKETIKMAHAWYTGRKITQNYKKKDPKTKVVGITFPVSELVYSMGAVPLFPMRNELFTYNSIDKVLNGITTITKIFGWNSMDRLMKIAFFTSTGADVVEFFIENLLQALIEKYDMFNRISEEKGFPRDSCFGSRFLYANFINNSQYFDAYLNYSYRCGYLYKFHDLASDILKNNFILDVPPSSGESALRMVEEELMDFFSMMEELTGNRFSEDKLGEMVTISNEIKAMNKEFLYGMCTGDILPYKPLTFSFIQLLFQFSLIDYNSNIRAYRNNFKRLMGEFQDRISKGKGFNATGIPRMMYTPFVSGPEISNFQIVSELGGTLVLGDFEYMGFMETIDVNNNVLKNYASFLVNQNNFMGTTNEVFAKSAVNFARDMKCDGVLFQDAFGCKNIGPILKMFKEFARQYGIPVLETSFNSVGENLEQNRTRIEAFLEMLE